MSEIMNKAENFCEFCDILQKGTEQLLYKDSEFFAFYDINKASAVEHILVCTNEHLESCYNIRDPARVRRMQQVGENILKGLNKGNQFRFGFHTGAFISIHHVHLHCFILPFSNILQDKVRYGQLLTSVDDVCRKLNKGKL
jgi:diadenosine tetraphosphate (Ap4A) HIT family hydrolase